MKSIFIYHELYMWHNPGPGVGMIALRPLMEPSRLIEKPEAKRRLRNLLDVAGELDLMNNMKPRPATEEELLRVHSRDYLDRIRKASEEDGGGEAGDHAPFGPGSFNIAQLAAGGCIQGAEAIVKGEARNGYALVRPPGHHAEPERGRGFCMLANVSLAAKHLLAKHSDRTKRIAIVDWDVHHGNGTQKVFYEDSSVLTISIHQDKNYPRDSGFMDEIGEGHGQGYNINVPLPPGCGHGAYMSVMDRVVTPALDAFDPDFIFVACGYDACSMDPLGHMMLHSNSYRFMTRRILDAADRLCDGRVLVVHEGGYSEEYVPYCGLAVVEELNQRSNSNSKEEEEKE
eukprot:gb/GECH01014337.1/.p1 GENE.gb/GECH01014337.1/~~gb/GECH01014337.1/.p1  ORF type:complete len:343 (+),score=94.80 gb/GECH01014337.1/:1-1029(+)